MRPGILTLLLAACTPPPNVNEVPDYVDGTPEIASFSVECVVEKDQWELTLSTTYWTGGADSFWSDDGEVVEVHALKTDRFAEDGQGEDLSLNLAIAVDPADAGDGSTAFTCGEDPSGLLVVYETDDTPVVCTLFGSEAVDWESVPDLPECP